MQKNKTYMALQTGEEPTVHNLYIYDDISKYGDFNWDTFDYDDSETSAKHIRDELEAIPDTDAINVFINCNGGDVYEAAAIASLLRRHTGNTTAIVDGAAHSAAFVIVQACKHRIMYSGTSALIHNAWTVVQGNAADLRQAADQLDELMDSIVKMFLERATVSEDELRDMMNKETMLTPEKALAYGLIDEIGTAETKIDKAPNRQGTDEETGNEEDPQNSVNQSGAAAHGFETLFTDRN